MNLDDIQNAELKLHIFDMGINASPRTAIRLIQRIVGVSRDGMIGKETTDSINKIDVEENLLFLYKGARRGYYRYISWRNPKLKVFLKGWLNRVNHTSL